jgi:putative protease
MKDMCSLEILPELLETGVDSLKIEGRMKNEYYVASAVDAYKELANDWVLNCFSVDKALKYKKKLANVFNRGGFCTGYYKQHNGRNMISAERPNNQGIEVGCVEDVVAGGVIIRLSENLYKGDVLEISLDDDTVAEITSNADFKEGEAARLNAPKSRHILKNSRVLRTRCNYILEDIRTNILERDNRIAVDGVFTAIPGERLSFTLNREINGEMYSATAYGEMVDRARIGSPDVEKICQKLSQLGETDYYFRNLHMEVDADAFVPASNVKKLRREALELLDSEVLSRSRRNRFRRKDKIENPAEPDNQENGAIENYENLKHLPDGKIISTGIKYRIGVSTVEQFKILLDELEGFLRDGEDFAGQLGIYVSTYIYKRLKTTDMDRLKNADVRLILELPYVFKDDFDIDAINPDLSVVVGIYVRNIGGYAALKCSKLYEKVENGQLELVIGSSLYAYNHQSLEFIGEYLYENPQELNIKELSKLYEKPGYRGELLVYGYQTVMISAQCITGNFAECVNDKSGAMVVRKITDDKGNVFYSRACCDECINVIYNGVPYSIMDKLDEVKTYISPESFRINFTIENEDTVRLIMNEIINYNISGEIKLPEKVYTAGHIYRGVE